MAEYRDDPYAGHNFEITIDGINDGKSTKGAFAEVSGLEVTIDPIEYRNGIDDITVRKRQGLKKYTNITLKRGLLGDLSFWNWIMQAMNGLATRQSGHVALLDEDKKEVMRWNFKNAWPCKWTGPGLNAKNNEISMETLELCHEGLSIVGQVGSGT